MQTQIKLVLKSTLTLQYLPYSRWAMLSADSSCYYYFSKKIKLGISCDLFRASDMTYLWTVKIQISLCVCSLTRVYVVFSNYSLSRQVLIRLKPSSLSWPIAVHWALTVLQYQNIVFHALNVCRVPMKVLKTWTRRARVSAPSERLFKC